MDPAQSLHVAPDGERAIAVERRFLAPPRLVRCALLVSELIGTEARDGTLASGMGGGLAACYAALDELLAATAR
jgi:hypothetical protein